MLMKQLIVLAGVALAGSSVVVIAIHFGLKFFKPGAFVNTRPKRRTEVQRRLEQPSATLAEAMGSYFAERVESRNAVAQQRVRSTLGNVLAPSGQPRSTDSMAVPPFGDEHQHSGATNAAQFGASS